MKLAIGCDHAGLDLKEELIRRLSQTHELLDVGTDSLESVDYPHYGRAVAEAVVAGNVERGILVCGTGIGMAITANKVAGVRAAVIHDTFSARVSVEHNNVNVLTLGSRVIGPELAYEVIQAFLSGQFTGGRHQRRLDLITRLEEDGARGQPTIT